MKRAAEIRVGTAGWSIPRASALRFDAAGTHLARYARLLDCVEINSCFYRPHRITTYEKWRDSTPDDFRFAVKLPKAITHELRLRDSRELLMEFLQQTSGLGAKRGPILMQLPPSFDFAADVVEAFLDVTRREYGGLLVVEPRHPTWFSPAVEMLLERYQVARAAADPLCAPGAEMPGGWRGVAYFRLHGSPRMYWSRYDRAYLERLTVTLRSAAEGGDTWCVFDNTGGGSAVENACELAGMLRGEAPSEPQPRADDAPTW